MPWDSQQRDSNPAASVLTVNEINNLRAIFRHAPFKFPHGFQSVQGGFSENSGPESLPRDSNGPRDSDRDSACRSPDPLTNEADDAHDSRNSIVPFPALDAPQVAIDAEARKAMEKLAGEGGGWDPRRVTVPKTRAVLGRGQTPVRLLIKAWKYELAFSSPAAPAALPPVPEIQAFDRVQMLLPNPSPAQEAIDESTARIECFLAFAVAFIELVGRQAGGAEIYDTAVIVYPVGFGRSHARVVLKRYDHPRLERTFEGQYRLKDSVISTDARPMPVPYHSRRPSAARLTSVETKAHAKQKRDLARRKDFADFTVEYLIGIDHPAGPYEIYDAAEDAGRHLDFTRDSARDILIKAWHPKLRRLNGGRFWLADRPDVPETRASPYFNRTARPGYPALGQELVAILTARRCAMTTPELADRLSQEARAALPHYHASYAFGMAAKHFPQLRLMDSYWRLIDLPEDRPRGLTLDQEAAVYAIDICNMRGPSTLGEIAARLPAYLRPLINLAESLERSASSFPSLVEQDGRWFVDGARTIFARKA